MTPQSIDLKHSNKEESELHLNINMTHNARRQKYQKAHTMPWLITWNTPIHLLLELKKEQKFKPFKCVVLCFLFHTVCELRPALFLWLVILLGTSSSWAIKVRSCTSLSIITLRHMKDSIQDHPLELRGHFTTFLHHYHSFWFACTSTNSMGIC